MTSAQGAHENVLRDAEERRRVGGIEAERDALRDAVRELQDAAQVGEQIVVVRLKDWREFVASLPGKTHR